MIHLAHLSIDAVKGPMSIEAVDRGIISLQSLLEWVGQLPFKRNSQQGDYRLVFTEECGTCSTKHALVKQVAIENDWKDVLLLSGLYQMNGKTNPKIAKYLENHKVEYFPELYFFLKIDGKIFDLCNADFVQETFKNTLTNLEIINPSQIGAYITNKHKELFLNWCLNEQVSFDIYWAYREHCMWLLENGD